MALLDNLRPGAEVITTDRKHVGKLYAVVVDERDDEVTHIVVNTGPFFPAPGFGAPNLVNVPVEEMADAREKEVVLKCTKKKFSRMRAYAEWSFGPQTSRQVPKGLPADTPVWQLALSRSLAAWSIATPTETVHKRSFEREIPHGAHVWRVDPHIHIGDVDRVLMDEATDELEAFVIRRGLLFGHDVILPVRYVTEILDDVVHVAISDKEIERLEEFRAPSEP